MTEQQFLSECDATLRSIEWWCDHSELDVDVSRQDLVLTIEFDDGARLIVNGNAPVREIWLAARSGAQHFAWHEAGWADTRTAEPLDGALARVISGLSGQSVQVTLA